MRMGRVIGRVWATAKDEKLTGIQLSVLQPLDEEQKEAGAPLIAADMINSRMQDIVYWVTGAEATFALPDHQIPSDASIVGLVDRMDREKS
jgi:ethanolamine utilization protein EutN